MNPWCLRLKLSGPPMYQGPCLCNYGGWLEVLICCLGSFLFFLSLQAFQMSPQKKCIWSTVTANNITEKCIDAVQKLALQWKNRLLQLKALNASTKAALVHVHEWQCVSVPDVIFNEVIYTDVNYGYKVSPDGHEKKDTHTVHFFLLSRPQALNQHLPLEREDSKPQALGCQAFP
ncbi:uncharacterized protein [Chamaea fasciata]|uniref:uncharacterized protein isoform X4 n=1 Tax=Chamaea fasciata TaxID=190680 RepID=UPI00336A4AC4